jgi:hypothetical protein
MIFLTLCKKKEEKKTFSLGFEAFTAVTMKNAFFSDVTPCGSCKRQCFGGM